MASETPKDIDRAAIEAHAQRVAEQTALRKVRKTLDSIGESEADERRSLRRVLVACAILAVLGAWLVLSLVFGDRGLPKQLPMKVPLTLPQKQ